ncbi:hypothetical protein JTB14_010015 [Gonioctena quinquepunctata]|nr:hypothetical protein JTB14_010015 [Gonioctena quinquepunctata]
MDEIIVNASIDAIETDYESESEIPLNVLREQLMLDKARTNITWKKTYPMNPILPFNKECGVGNFVKQLDDYGPDKLFDLMLSNEICNRLSSVCTGKDGKLDSGTLKVPPPRGRGRKPLRGNKSGSSRTKLHGRAESTINGTFLYIPWVGTKSPERETPDILKMLAETQSGSSCSSNNTRSRTNSTTGEADMCKTIQSRFAEMINYINNDMDTSKRLTKAGREGLIERVQRWGLEQANSEGRIQGLKEKNERLRKEMKQNEQPPDQWKRKETE